MTTYTDAILHIADVPALIAAMPPEMVSEGGAIIGIARTETRMNGVAGLTYVRMTAEQVAQWRGTPGVTVLAEAPYQPGAVDVVYQQVFADPDALALYRSVYDPQPITLEDGTTYQEPERFGALA